MQTGIGFNDSEVKGLIKLAASEASGVDYEDLEVFLSYSRGEVTACVTHIDRVSPVKLLSS